MLQIYERISIWVHPKLALVETQKIIGYRRFSSKENDTSFKFSSENFSLSVCFQRIYIYSTKESYFRYFVPDDVSSTFCSSVKIMEYVWVKTPHWIPKYIIILSASHDIFCCFNNLGMRYKMMEIWKDGNFYTGVWMIVIYSL